MRRKPITEDEEWRFYYIVNPASQKIAELRADELIAVSCGDLGRAETLHQEYNALIAKLRIVLKQWQDNKTFKQAQRALRSLLNNHV